MKSLWTSIVTSGPGAAASLAGLAVLCLLSPPPVALILTMAGAAVLAARWRWIRRFPLRTPVVPGDEATKACKAQGILFLGHERESEREVWLSAGDTRGGMLVLGRTGAAKTDALLGMAANALGWGSGFVYLDGTGSVSTFARVYELCDRYDRVQDMAVINLLAPAEGTAKEIPAYAWGMSNSMNPFRKGAPSFLVQMVVGMVPDTETGSGSIGEISAWKGRATAMLDGVLRALCWLRDHRDLDLDIGVLREHLDLAAMIRLSGREDIPATVRESISFYLEGLTGYQISRGEIQVSAVVDQHLRTMLPLAGVLRDVAAAYGHVFRAGGADVDIEDVVLNRRVLLVLLPAPQAGGMHAVAAGRIVMGCLKAVMASMVSSRPDATWDEDDRPRLRNPSPYTVVADDVGPCMVEGTALMAAVSRGAGISMVFSAPDTGALAPASPREASSIVANTAVRISMDVDPEGTGAVHATLGLRDTVVRYAPFRAWMGNDGERRKRLRLRRNQLVNLSPAPSGDDLTERSDDTAGDQVA